MKYGTRQHAVTAERQQSNLASRRFVGLSSPNDAGHSLRHGALVQNEEALVHVEELVEVDACRQTDEVTEKMHKVNRTN